MEPQACAYVQTHHDTLNVCRDLICEEECVEGLTEYVKAGAWSMRKKKKGHLQLMELFKKLLEQ